MGRPWSWRRGRFPATLTVLVTLLLTLHRFVPNTLLHLGSLLETVLLWLVLVVVVLLEVSLLQRSFLALVTATLSLVAWLATFGGLFVPVGDDGDDLTVVQHNVSDVNPDPAATARSLSAARPDLIGLVEVTDAPYDAVFRERYPYHTVQGTVGLWSRFPLVDARHLDIKPGGLQADWNRGLRAVAQTPHGDVAVYVAHLPSVRIGLSGFDTARRDDSARKLGAALRAEPLPRVILIGDLNGTVDDRGLRPVSSQLTWAPRGVALSWPAKAPVARIDQVMARGVTVRSVRALPETASDHLPIAARLAL
jgi:vancomycin resistance protein VanJ